MSVLLLLLVLERDFDGKSNSLRGNGAVAIGFGFTGPDGGGDFLATKLLVAFRQISFRLPHEVACDVPRRVS